MQNEMYELRNKSLQSFYGQVIGQLISGASVFVIGRTLGATMYGEYIYVYTFLSFFCTITKLGMENALIYNISRNDIIEQQKSNIILFVLKQSVIVGVILIILGYVFSGWILMNLLNGSVYRILFFTLLPSIIIDAILDLLISVLRANKKILEMTTAKNVVANSVKIATILIIFYGFKMNNNMVLVISQYLGSLASIIYILKVMHIKASSIYKFNSQKLILQNNKKIEIYRYSMPLIFMKAIVLLNHNADKYMLGYMLDSKVVGVYTVAIYISNFSSFALDAVNGIFAPMIAEMYGSGKIKELDFLYKRVTRWVMIVNLAIFSMAINFSNEIMQFAGKEFYMGGEVLTILILGQVVNSGVGSAGYLNSMTGHTKINLLTSIFALAVNLCFNIVLIPDYGMVGAAVASAISVGLSNILNLGFAYKNLKVFPYTKRYLGVLAAFVTSTLLLKIFAKSISSYYVTKLLLGGILFVIIYLICVYLWALENDEKQMIKQSLKLKIK